MQTIGRDRAVNQSAVAHREYSGAGIIWRGVVNDAAIRHHRRRTGSDQTKVARKSIIVEATALHDGTCTDVDGRNRYAGEIQISQVRGVSVARGHAHSQVPE